MSWSYETIEQWVNSALLNCGYSESEAQLGADSVTWLQQRGAPGVAAMAQHIDFLSAYELTPNQGGDLYALCPIQLSAALHAQAESTQSAKTFSDVRQPLLLLPVLAKHAGTVHWNDYVLELNDARLNIEYQRKTLRQVLIEKTDVHWEPNQIGKANESVATGSSDIEAEPTSANEAAPSYCHMNLLTEIPARELVYIKTLQHYAGALPPREPLDGAPTTDNPFGMPSHSRTEKQPESQLET